MKIAMLVEHALLRVNYDTGSAYLGGEDIYAALERIGPRLVHMHAKDISAEHSDAERGKVTGTPVGCACGDRVVDWARVISATRKHGFDGVLSVECGSPNEAARSLAHLKAVITAAAAGA